MLRAENDENALPLLAAMDVRRDYDMCGAAWVAAHAGRLGRDERPSRYFDSYVNAALLMLTDEVERGTFPPKGGK